jgi:predicted DNA-binding transcriptional regulator YafY
MTGLRNVLFNPPTTPTDVRQVVIDYTNHRGERRKRVVVPSFVAFEFNEWHPQAQWLLHAWDVEKAAMRTFAMAGIHEWLPR